jgi:hypothetical protein
MRIGELLAGLFAAIGSYPHIVATRAAPIEMRASMPPKRRENHAVLTPATRALVADRNLVFRTRESPFGHRQTALYQAQRWPLAQLILKASEHYSDEARKSANK